MFTLVLAGNYGEFTDYLDRHGLSRAQARYEFREWALHRPLHTANELTIVLTGHYRRSAAYDAVRLAELERLGVTIQHDDLERAPSRA